MKKYVTFYDHTNCPCLPDVTFPIIKWMVLTTYMIFQLENAHGCDMVCIFYAGCIQIVDFLVGTLLILLKPLVFWFEKWHVQGRNNFFVLETYCILSQSLTCVTFIKKYVTFYDRNNCICIRNVNFPTRKYLFFLKTMLSPMENNHFHNPCITHIAFLFRTRLFDVRSLNIYFRSLNDPWAILERSLNEIHINTMKTHHFYPKDRSRIAQGSPKDRFQWSQGSILSEL